MQKEVASFEYSFRNERQSSTGSGQEKCQRPTNVAESRHPRDSRTYNLQVAAITLVTISQIVNLTQ